MSRRCDVHRRRRRCTANASPISSSSCASGTVPPYFRNIRSMIAASSASKLSPRAAITASMESNAEAGTYRTAPRSETGRDRAQSRNRRTAAPRHRSEWSRLLGSRNRKSDCYSRSFGPPPHRHFHLFDTALVVAAESDTMRLSPPQRACAKGLAPNIDQHFIRGLAPIAMRTIPIRAGITIHPWFRRSLDDADLRLPAVSDSTPCASSLRNSRRPRTLQVAQTQS